MTRFRKAVCTIVAGLAIALLAGKMATKGRPVADSLPRQEVAEDAGTTNEPIRDDFATKRLVSFSEPNGETSSGRHALLVGCTYYPSLPMIQHLNGPVNDIHLIRELLIERYGFSDQQISVLSEEAGGDRLPTRANIEREFRRLAERARPGDQIFILLAGHGSQQPDDDPDNADDPEPDGYDEIFLPRDIGDWNGTKQQVENAISDDEIRVWLNDIRDRGAFVWIVIDACHSGTMIRGGDEKLRQVPPEQLVPREALLQAARRAGQLGERTRGGGAESTVMDLARGDTGVVALYASQPSEPTVELRLPPAGQDRSYYGLLTYAVNQVLVQAQTPLTYRELTQRVHAQYSQWKRMFPTPMLEGTHLDREVLGQVDWQGRSQILLARDANGVYSVNAGSLHGLTADSVLAVRPPAGEADGQRVLGHVRIEQVQPLQAQVEPCEHDGVPAQDDLPENGECRLVFQHFGDLRLRVAADPLDTDDNPAPGAAVQRVTAALRELAANEGALVQCAETASDADWLVRIGGDRVYLVPVSGFAVPPGKNPADVAPPLFGPVLLDDALADNLDERLRRIARVTNLLGLCDDDSGGVIQVGSGLDVAVELLRFTDVKKRQFEVVGWDNGRSVRAGDVVGFRVANRGRESVDATLLFIDCSFGIHAYFPESGFIQNNQIAAGESYVSAASEVTPATGSEHIVLIAVRSQPGRSPINFGFLEQEGLDRVRGTPGTGQILETPLGKLLETALLAEGQTRGMKRVAVDNHAIRRLTWRVAEAQE
jgi:hypothetical protein